VKIPADGGYILTLLTSRRGRLKIDTQPAAQSPDLRMQVCGFYGDAVQPTQTTAALQEGLHRIHIEIGTGMENSAAGVNGEPVLYWEGPGTSLAPIPAHALVSSSR
jgi:hypothetical protein